MADGIDDAVEGRGVGDTQATMVVRGQAPGGQAGLDLGARAVDQHQAHAQAVQQHQVVDDIAEVRMLYTITGQHDHKGAVAVGIDVGRSVAKPVDVFGHNLESL
ncbi:hypothetical protein D3C80_1137900 [compost metagenome]